MAISTAATLTFNITVWLLELATKDGERFLYKWINNVEKYKQNLKLNKMRTSKETFSFLID